MIQRTLLLLGGMFLAGSAVAGSDSDSDTAGQWLERMAQAVENLNYRGTVVYLRDGRVETLRVLHRVDEDGVRERIFSLNGARREILRDRDEIRCLFADDQGLVVRSPLTGRLAPELSAESVQAGYHYRFAGQDRVAGLAAQIIEITPRDEFRYGHRLWLEEDTGMLLRSELLDSEQRVKQQLMFTEIELGAHIDDGELDPGEIGEMFHVATTSKTPSGDLQASWLPERLPPGFELTAVKRGESGEHKDFEHLLFSDGLASFSIYLEPREEDEHEPPAGGSLNTVGAVNIYTRAIEDTKITVVGEVPASTVRQIGRQLQPIK